MNLPTPYSTAPCKASGGKIYFSPDDIIAQIRSLVKGFGKGFREKGSKKPKKEQKKPKKEEGARAAADSRQKQKSAPTVPPESLALLGRSQPLFAVRKDPSRLADHIPITGRLPAIVRAQNEPDRLKVTALRGMNADHVFVDSPKHEPPFRSEKPMLFGSLTCF